VDESWRYGIGISYTNGFGEPKTFPVMAVNYLTEEAPWVSLPRYDLILPINPEKSPMVLILPWKVGNFICRANPEMV